LKRQIARSGWNRQWIDQPLLTRVALVRTDRACQQPALAALAPLQVELEGGVHSLGVIGQLPVETPAQLQALALADGEAPLLLDAHMADPGGSGRWQRQGFGDPLLGEFNLQAQRAQHGCAWRRGQAAAGPQRQTEQQHRRQQQMLDSQGPMPWLLHADRAGARAVRGARQGGQHGVS